MRLILNTYLLFNDNLAHSAIGIAYNLNALLCSTHLLTAEIIAFYYPTVSSLVVNNFVYSRCSRVVAGIQLDIEFLVITCLCLRVIDISNRFRSEGQTIAIEHSAIDRRDTGRVQTIGSQ